SPRRATASATASYAPPRCSWWTPRAADPPYHRESHRRPPRRPQRRPTPGPERGGTVSDNEGIRADWATKDFYAVLGVNKKATPAEIKKAYRRLARDNHPDSNPGDSAESRAKHEKFKAVAEAYDVVGDEEKR